MLVLSDPLQRQWADGDVFAVVDSLQGVIYREVANRRTLRFELAGSTYFAKVHHGVGWSEIFKNLVTLRLPVLGAWNEFEACEHLRGRGVRVPDVIGFGTRGLNPATRRSFVILEDLGDYTSLEDVTAKWRSDPPSVQTKRALIDAVARLARDMHAAGVNHRDFYICHVLVAEDVLGHLPELGEIQLALIDLHRAQIREKTPRRWLKRDLAALLFSVLELPVSRRDWMRFLRTYAGERPSVVIRRDRAFWDAVVARAHTLSPESPP